MRGGEVDFVIFPAHAIVEGHPQRDLFQDDFVCIAWEGNELIGDELSQDEFVRLRHVVTSYPHPSQIELAYTDLGLDLDFACRVPSFSQVAHFVVDTPYIATIHARLIPTIPADLPLRFFRPPVHIEPLREVLQWHHHRGSDPQTRWLVEQMFEVAATLPPTEGLVEREPETARVMAG